MVILKKGHLGCFLKAGFVGKGAALFT
jgi:hypothetical protein